MTSGARCVEDEGVRRREGVAHCEEDGRSVAAGMAGRSSGYGLAAGRMRARGYSSYNTGILFIAHADQIEINFKYHAQVTSNSSLAVPCLHNL